MIYVSTSCVRNDLIRESVRELAAAGFRNIELSGGTQPYEALTSDLLALKKELGLHYLAHNYFPPPPVPFVLNLASLDQEVSRMSLEHCKRSIDLSHTLGGEKYGIHAGFFIDIKLSEIGKKISKENLFDEEKALDLFCENWLKVQAFSGDDLELYLENNVLSASNYASFEQENPFLLTHEAGYRELRERIDFKLLLDVAHLKVSTNVLGLDFEKELRSLSSVSDYIHLSDNDGKHDTNRQILAGSALSKSLSQIELKGKKLTLEVYEGLETVKSSYDIVNDLVHD